MRAAVYSRISRDREGAGLGVKRQEADCRALADARGWEVVATFEDNDLSAYSGRPRGGYDAMLDAIRAGTVDAVLAWHLDRLHRHPRELEAFMEVVEAHGVTVATVKAGDIDLATSAGRLAARIVGATARNESEQKSERLRRKHEELAASGRYQGGPRPYGYQQGDDGTLVVVDAEAAIVREAAERVLAGETLYGIADDLNRRGVPTARGAKWRTPTLRRMLTSPTVAGKRTHRGEVVADAAWLAILPETTRARVARTLGEPSRSRPRPARSYLLTGGLARCGHCDGPLKAQRRVSGARSYVCITGPDGAGCGRLSCAADPFEAHVVEDVLTLLDASGVADRLAGDEPDDAPLEAELAEVDGRLDDLADLFAAGEVSRAEWLRARQGLDRRRQQIADTLAASTPRRIISTGAPVREAWEDLTLDQRRALVAAVVESIVVRPAERRGPVFDPARVEIRWRP